MTKPEPEEENWRLRCQGRLKLGSLCTVKTCGEERKEAKREGVCVCVWSDGGWTHVRMA